MITDEFLNTYRDNLTWAIKDNDFVGEDYYDDIKSINKDDLFNIEIVVPTLQKMKMFEEQASVIDKQIVIKDKEINNLTELQSLLLARMGH